MYLRLAVLLQICGYGRALLDQLPPTARTSVLVAVTDLQRIQFYKMTRPAQGQGLFTYQRSQEMSPVLPALCAVLSSEPNQVCALHMCVCGVGGLAVRRMGA
jgi:hypothetical protein